MVKIIIRGIEIQIIRSFLTFVTKIYYTINTLFYKFIVTTKLCTIKFGRNSFHSTKYTRAFYKGLTLFKYIYIYIFIYILKIVRSTIREKF